MEVEKGQKVVFRVLPRLWSNRRKPQDFEKNSANCTSISLEIYMAFSSLQELMMAIEELE